MKNLLEQWNICWAAAKSAEYDLMIRNIEKPLHRIIQYLGKNDLYQDRLDCCTQSLENLSKKFSNKNLDLDNEFIDTLQQTQQKIGELDFAAIAKIKNINLKPVQTLKKEGKSKISEPDYQLDEYEVFFEVKTFAIVTPKENYPEFIKQATKAHQNRENDLQQGNIFAITTLEHQPYKSRLKEKGNIRNVIETLHSKIKQNLKLKQFNRGKTYLVVNLLELPIFSNGPEQIRPAFFSDHDGLYPETGALWMTAFAKPGNLLFFPPEFPGKPSIEGSANFCGILQEYTDVKGIIWIVHNLDGAVMPMLTIREEDSKSLRIDTEGEWNQLNKIVGDHWNDDVDTNGFNLMSLKI